MKKDLPESIMPKLYTVETLAELFSRHRNTILRWINEEVFPHAFKVKDGWYVPEEDVNALMGKNGEKAASPKTSAPTRRSSGFVTGWK